MGKKTSPKQRKTAVTSSSPVAKMSARTKRVSVVRLPDSSRARAMRDNREVIVAGILEEIATTTKSIDRICADDGVIAD